VDEAKQLQRDVRSALRTRRTVVVVGGRLEVLRHDAGAHGTAERSQARGIGARARRTSRARGGRTTHLDSTLHIGAIQAPTDAASAAAALWGASWGTRGLG
jgi:hypothetical protein